MSRVFLALILCSVCSVQASEWEYLGETNEFKYELDKQTIKLSLKSKHVFFSELV